MSQTSSICNTEMRAKGNEKMNWFTGDKYWQRRNYERTTWRRSAPYAL